MATPANPVTFPSNLEYVVRADLNVNTDDLTETMKSLLQRAGMAHAAMFSIPLCVTSGKDGDSHVAGSAHLRGAAADLRSNDKTAEQQTIFGQMLSYIAQRYSAGVYDERGFKAGEAHWTGGHWHVEVA